ncbi:MAG: primosomal protein N' (replication factor Y) [Bacteroidia bacterium]|jgi:primosomal protein N' (replication factor Y)
MSSYAQFVEVILPLPLAGTFTYRVPRTLEEEVQVGKRVTVPFGRRKLYTGIIHQIHDRPPTNYQAKYIDDLLDDEPVIFDEQLAFWDWMRQYYMCHLGDVMNAAIPSGLKLSSASRLTIHPDYDGTMEDLEPEEMDILEALQNTDFLTMDDLSTLVRKTHIHRIIRLMSDKRIVVQYEELQHKFKPKKEIIYRLAEWLEDKEKLEEIFDTLNRAPKQLETLMQFLQCSRTSKEKGIVKRQILVGDHGVSDAAVNALIKKEVLIKEEIEAARLIDKSSWAKHGIVLTENQDKAFDQVSHALVDKDAVLLHGITGSGKTEIYIQLIQEHLANGNQVLYMLPEIALTTQIIHRLQEHFGEKVGIYHSKISDNERVEVWKKQLTDEPYQIILGARSSLFLPFKKLGFVIIDEEHEHTFKQHDPAPRYHARDAAAFLCKQAGAKLLLGSATPSIEAYYNGKRDKIGLVHLNERYGGIQLPHVELCDLNVERKAESMKGPFSSQLLQRITETLGRNQQVIIFQNRRGYSSFLQCNNCGWVPDCINCDISLTYHKYSQDVRCHYCGHGDKAPQICPQCKSTYIKTKGFGTEQIEEELSLHFPEAAVARMDLDTTRGKHSYARIISAFEENRVQILVGTQMVTKGLDFDHVGLVGILNADALLNYPDFRAFERAYQLMAQVSGRAGRKGRRGLVVVQTSDPQHFIIEQVVRNDYQGMYETELAQRKQFRYPPFIRMITITIKHRDRDVVDRAADVLANALQNVPDKLLLGPEYPLVQRIRNKYNKQIILKMGGQNIKERKERIFEIIREIHSIKEFRSVFFQPDVDPI